MKGFAVDGATTNHGGVIRATQQFHNHMGLPLLRAGDGHYCPQCKCWSTIQKSHNHIIFEGQPVAYEDDFLSCGAKIMHQQNHMVGDSQGSFTISFGELPQEMPTQNVSATQSNSLVDSKKELTEEEKEKLCFCQKELTEEVFNKITPKGVLFKQSKYPKIKNMDRTIFLNALNDALEKFEINTCLRKAHFLAHVICESAHLQTTEEYYDKKQWDGYEGGPNYHGRGLLQLTHKKNYEKFSKSIGEDVSSEQTCNLVASDPKYTLLSAAWYWTNGSAWKNGNPHADRDDLHYTTMLINGGFNGYCERKESLIKILEAMEVQEKCETAKKLTKPVGVYSFEQSDLMEKKVGKKIWLNYHKNVKLKKHVSCEDQGNVK